MTRQIGGNMVYVTDEAIKRIIAGAAVMLISEGTNIITDDFVLEVEKRWAGLDAGPIETWEIVNGYAEQIMSLASMAMGNTYSRVDLEKQVRNPVEFPIKLLSRSEWR